MLSLGLGYRTPGGLSGGQLQPQTVVNRLTGIAPLAVLVDASGTTNTSFTALPWHELDYAHDFGEAGGVELESGAGHLLLESGSGTLAIEGAGTWAYGNNGSAGTGMGGQTDFSAAIWLTDKNKAYGPLGPHVFDRPGTYPITTTVSNGTQTATTSLQVVVGDPALTLTTVYLSPSGNAQAIADLPQGAAVTVDADRAHIVATYTASNSPAKRILLHAGETFTWDGTGAPTILSAGPGIIGTYGSGAQPVVRLGGDTSSPFLKAATGANDWRIQNLKWDCNSHQNAGGWNNTTTVAQILLYQITVTGGASGFQQSNNSASVNADQLFVVSCSAVNVDGQEDAAVITGSVSGTALTVSGVTSGAVAIGQGIYDINNPGTIVATTVVSGAGSSWVLSKNLGTVTSRQLNLAWAGTGYGSFCNGLTNSAFLGNDFENFTRGIDHVWRLQRHTNVAVGHNLFARSGNQPVLAHGDPAAVSHIGVSSGLVFSDNLVISDTAEGGPFTIGPQFGSAPDSQNVDDIVERNFFICSAADTNALTIEGARITIRDNIVNWMHRSGAVGAIDVKITDRNAASYQSDAIAIYGNTFFHPNNTGASNVVQAPATGIGTVDLTNNIFYVPGAGSSTLTATLGGAATFAGYKSASPNSNSGPISNPTFTNSSGTMSSGFSTPADYTPTSVAFLTAAAVPVPYNFFRSATHDIGAV